MFVSHGRYEEFIVNQANPAHPLIFTQYHFYRKRQQGAVFFYHTNGVRCEVVLVIYKRDCSLLPLSVEMVPSELKRVSRICLVSATCSVTAVTKKLKIFDTVW